jgi:hypothetical protein
MLNIHKNIVLNDKNQPIAIQISIEDYNISKLKIALKYVIPKFLK